MSGNISMQPDASELVPGRVVSGRFIIRAPVSTDGFGELVAAQDQKTGQAVCLRTLRNPAFAAHLRAIVKAIGDLSHPNLVATYGLAQTERGAPLIVQGMIEGQHVAAFALAHVGGKPVSLRGAFNVVAHVCNALSVVHATGPHGAVRPGAVWIGTDGRVQLADLVIARAALAAGGTAGLPDAEAAYLAPELKMGQPPGVASDLFGLGALLYVLLTGRSPMDAFVPPSQAHPEATSAVDQELLRALSPDPRARHATPEAFRLALLPLMGGAEQETRDDFGVDVEVEVSLASMPPSRAPGSNGQAVNVPRAPRLPRESGPQAGMRVSLADGFRVSIVEDETEAAAARERRSLGEVALKDVLAKITEDDAPRWMLVKEGMDHGPFSGRQVVNMIVQGNARADHELMNTDTGRRGKISEFGEFTEFLAQYELKRSEEERVQKLKKSEVQEKRGAVFKVGIGIGALALVGLVVGLYAITRSGAENGGRGSADASDLYKRGSVELSGSAGILPIPKPGSGGARRPGGGGGGGGMSYEDAMMQAVDIGSAAAGGEQQLSAAAVAGVMNRQLNGIFDACVRGSVGNVQVDLAIAGSGQVLGVSVRAGDANFQRCVASQVRRVRFPSFSAPRMGARYSFGT
jgi:serine/threonine protein kinase